MGKGIYIRGRKARKRNNNKKISLQAPPKCWYLSTILILQNMTSQKTVILKKCLKLAPHKIYLIYYMNLITYNFHSKLSSQKIERYLQKCV
jgi:hypothetical protein